MIEFRVLGPLEIVEDGRLVRAGGQKQRALLALFLLHANEVVSADRLIDELWGEGPPETVATMLHVYVSRLRKALGPERIVTRPPGYLLHVEPGELDLERFEGLAVEGRAALSAGDAVAASGKLGEGLACWRGPALADLAYEPFAQREIARLETSALVGDIDSAVVLYGLLVPWGAFNAVDEAEGMRGSLSRYLGILATTLGRLDAAARHFEDALEMNARMGARPWLAYTEYDYGRMLLARNELGDRERALELLASARESARELGMVALEKSSSALLEATSRQ